MVFEKLREDFLDMYPNTNFIRKSYIKYLQTNQSSEKDFVTVKFKNPKQQMISNSHEKINWIPQQNLLSIYLKKSFVLLKQSIYSLDQYKEKLNSSFHEQAVPIFDRFHR